MKTMATIFFGMLLTLMLIHTSYAQTPNLNRVTTPVTPTDINDMAVAPNGDLYSITVDQYNTGLLGIHRSTDGGNTWTFVSTDPEPGVSANGGGTLEIDVSGNIYITDKNIWRIWFENDVLQWEKLEVGGGLFSWNTELESDSENNLFSRQNGDNGVYHSADTGDSWTKVYAPSDDLRGLYMGSDDRLYVWGDPGIVATSDQGVTWDTLYTGDVEYFTEGPNGTLISGWDKHIIVSEDSGENWTDTEMEEFYNGIYFDGDATLFANIANKGVYISSDTAKTWTEVNTGLFEPQFGGPGGIMMPLQDGTMLLRSTHAVHETANSQVLYRFNSDTKEWDAVATEDLYGYVIRDYDRKGEQEHAIFANRYFTKSVSEDNWTEVTTDPQAAWLAVEAIDQDTIYLAGLTNMYRTVDGGSSWTEIEPEGFFGFGATQLFNAGGYTFAKKNLGLYRQDRSNGNWVTISDSFDGSWSKIFFNEHDGSLFVNAGGAQRSSDYGDSWNEIEDLDGLINKPLAMAFQDSQTMFAISTNSMKKSTDGGVSWTTINDDFKGRVFGNIDASHFEATSGGAMLLNVDKPDAEDPENSFGLFYSDSEGSSWTHVGSDQNYAGSISFMDLVNDELIIGTAGFGMYTTGELIGTNIADGPQIAEIPEDFGLYQNYPNPFNPTTILSFSLTRAENVTLEVYDMMGRRVATLMTAEKFSPGNHQVSFDASHLSSGTYYYRIKTPTATATRAMTLIK